MTNGLTSLRAEQKMKQGQLQEAVKRRDTYSLRAAEIRGVYDKLKEQKDLAIEMRNQLNGYIGIDYPDFKGDNFTKKYQVTASSTVKSHDELICVIDRNLDSLNNEKMRFQGMALDQDGLIGQLTKALNWIGTQIENLVN